jgi:hypothetical protein
MLYAIISWSVTDILFMMNTVHQCEMNLCIIGLESLLDLGPACTPLQPTLAELVESLRVAVHAKQSKNVDVLHLSSRICHRMKGKHLRYIDLIKSVL